MARRGERKKIKKGQFFLTGGHLYVALQDFTLPEFNTPEDPTGLLHFMVDYIGGYLHELESAGLIRRTPVTHLEFYTDRWRGVTFRDR